MDFNIIEFQSSRVFTTQVENLTNGCLLNYLPNLFILAFIQEHTFVHTFIHIYMHNTEAWSRECSRRRTKCGQRLCLHEASDRSRNDRSLAGSVIAEVSFAWGKRPVPWWPELNLQRQVVGSVIAELSFAWGKWPVPWWPELNLQRQIVVSVIAEVSFAGSRRPVDQSSTCKGRYLAML
jgi:hypothetical protein